jgi:hypothetical protein
MSEVATQLTEFKTGVDFDEDVRGFSINEQKEIEGRNIPDGWHSVGIKSVSRLDSDADVRMDSLKPYYKSLFNVVFTVNVEGRKFPITHTALVSGKPLQLTSARTGNQYYPTASRLGSNLARATRVDSGFQGVLDAAMTTPLFAKFETNEAGYQSLERISAKMPSGNGAAA